MITGQELQTTWELIGKIGVVVGVIVALIKGFDYLMSKMPVSKLEVRVDKIETKVNNDFERFQEIDKRISNIEHRINSTDEAMKVLNQSIKLIGESQISLLHHFVTGNGQDEMEGEAQKLTRYFIEH